MSWLDSLRDHAALHGQRATGDLLGVSDTTVSQVLTGNYKASTVRIERRVRGELMGAECECPVMGDVSLRVCQDVQERPQGKGTPGIGNPQHAQAWHACRGSGRFASKGPCPHFNCGRKGGAAEAA